MKGSFNKTRQNYLHLVKRRTTQFNESNKNTDCVIINSVEVVRAESQKINKLNENEHVIRKHQTSNIKTSNTEGKFMFCFTVER